MRCSQFTKARSLAKKVTCNKISSKADVNWIFTATCPLFLEILYTLQTSNMFYWTTKWLVQMYFLLKQSLFRGHSFVFGGESFCATLGEWSVVTPPPSMHFPTGCPAFLLKPSHLRPRRVSAYGEANEQWSKRCLLVCCRKTWASTIQLHRIKHASH